MTTKEYKSHNSDWFSAQEAFVNKEIRNGRGEIIKEGEAVRIHCKSARGGFNITSKATGVTINRVDIHSVDVQIIATI